jgi:gluconolactonase
MFKKIFLLFLLVLFNHTVFANQVFSGFHNPESVVQDDQGNIYVTEIGEFGKDGDGKIKKIDTEGNISDFATGLNDPKGITIYQGELYATDQDVIVKIKMDGSWYVFAGTMSFPKTPVFLNDIDVTPLGTFYITDSGNLEGGGMIFIMDTSGKLEVLMDSDSNESIKAPNGILPLDNDRFLVVDFATGELFEGSKNSDKLNKLTDGLGGGDGIVILEDSILISDWKNGVIYEYKNNEVKILNDNFQAAADIAPTNNDQSIIVPDMKAGTVTVMDLN